MTQRQIGQGLGISAMTVSRALRGDGGISAETRERVLAVARKSGVAQRAARRPEKDKRLARAICVMAAGSPRLQDEAPFFARLNDGLRRGARECGGEILNCPEAASDWPVVVTRGQVDGVVLVRGDEHEPLPQTPCPVPQVCIFDGPPHTDVVTVDNFGGGVLLGEHLASLGHRRVAFVGPETRMSRERLAGLRTGLEPAGGACPPAISRLKLGAGGQEPDLLDALVSNKRRPTMSGRRFTVLACYNDWFAMHAIRRLREAGLRVPEDIGVTGFDDVMPIGYDAPRLTTCAIPIEEVGAEAVRLLYWRLEHPNAIRRMLVLNTELRGGDTVCSAR